MIIDKAKQGGVPIEYLSKHDLNVLTDNSVHQVNFSSSPIRLLCLCTYCMLPLRRGRTLVLGLQGLLLSCSPLVFVPLDDLGPASRQATDRGIPPVWLALDEVTDPVRLTPSLSSALQAGPAISSGDFKGPQPACWKIWNSADSCTGAP